MSGKAAVTHHVNIGQVEATLVHALNLVNGAAEQFLGLKVLYNFLACADALGLAGLDLSAQLQCVQDGVRHTGLLCLGAAHGVMGVCSHVAALAHDESAHLVGISRGVCFFHDHGVAVAVGQGHGIQADAVTDEAGHLCLRSCTTHAVTVDHGNAQPVAGRHDNRGIQSAGLKGDHVVHLFPHQSLHSPHGIHQREFGFPLGHDVRIGDILQSLHAAHDPAAAYKRIVLHILQINDSAVTALGEFVVQDHLAEFRLTSAAGAVYSQALQQRGNIFLF